jgi:hypothetical protein
MIIYADIIQQDMVLSRRKGTEFKLKDLLKNVDKTV